MARPGSPSPEAQQAWARVTIALNLRDVATATTRAREASALTDWADLRPTQKLGAARIHPCEEIPVGWCWIEPDQWRLAVARSVYEEFEVSNALVEFAEVILGMTEPGFRSFDPDNWRELDRLGF